MDIFVLEMLVNIVSNITQFVLLAIKHETKAFVRPPRACNILGIFIPSTLFANYDFPMVGSISP